VERFDDLVEAFADGGSDDEVSEDLSDAEAGPGLTSGAESNGVVRPAALPALIASFSDVERNASESAPQLPSKVGVVARDDIG